ncbi:MAG: amidohydrolase family protein [Alphaproteobacteria bacterium]|nr:amidohydrolase family protein [Alphaproteobacteria bacterium]
MTTTVIRDCAWIVAWDAEAGSHVYLRGGDVAFDESIILAVGGRWDRPAEREIDGRARMVMPGLVNLHAHPMGGSLDKGTFDEVGAPMQWGHALYHLSPLLEDDAEGIAANTKLAIAELLLSGVTTMVDLGRARDGWLDLIADTGIRGVIGAGFREAQWVDVGGHRVDYAWDKPAGRRAFDRALATVDAAERHPSGRLTGMIAPAQIDTVSEGLLRDAHAAAVERGMKLQVHAAQTMVEVMEMLRRHGMGAVSWLDHLGLLDERVILGHGIYLDHHTWNPLRTARELPMLAERGVTVAHCPTVFARTGMTLQTFGRYVKVGVRMGIGTDSFPHNMLEELRHVGYFARITAGDVHDHSTTDVFNAATIGGAGALGRGDLGRLTLGARADLVLVDVEHPAMRPTREPIRSLIIQAAERVVTDVFVDGTPVVRDGRCLTIDLDAEAAAVEDAQARALERLPSLDARRRTIDDIAPMTYPVRSEAL